MFNAPRKRIKDLPFNRIAPNLVTLAALASGVTSIRFSMEGRWEVAVIAILMASVFDALDGRVARMLHGASNFGAELDSLSDCVCFGVAPGLLMYFWTLENQAPAGWILALLVPLCCALRLARFNIMLDGPQPSYWKHFFVGLPAPGGAYVALTPIMLYLYCQNNDFQYAETLRNLFRSAVFVEVFLFLSAFLMASRLPTISLKKIRIPAAFLPVFLITAGLFIGALFYEPWLTVGVMGVVYIITVPFCSIVFLRWKKAALQEQAVEQKG